MRSNAEESKRQGTIHLPVMVEEVLEYLSIDENQDVLDCTLGGGGHSAAILEVAPTARIVAIDRDPNAIMRARDRFAAQENRINFYQSKFSDVKEVIQDRKFDGILADLGMSTDQLFEDRGFSFKDSNLNMRMDGDELCVSGQQIVNELSTRDLSRLLRRGGVRGDVNPIVRAIISARPIDTAEKLASVVNKVADRESSKERNPSTVVFQAIRIAVNEEIEELEALLDLVPKIIKSKGRFVVLTFHSIEDKIVTSRMRSWESGDTKPAKWPGVSNTTSIGRLVTKKAVVPADMEISKNPKSRSARLRSFQFV